MAKPINEGRWTVLLEQAPSEEPVLFLVGMRVNRWRALREWVPVARAMPAMLRELAAQPDLGLLSARTFMSGRDVMVVQYWRSLAHLHQYARAADHLHLPAWRDLNRRMRTSTVVGFWHETYRLRPGSFESIYVTMPAAGLAAALGRPVPVAAGRHSAAARMDPSLTDEPVVAA